MNKRVLTLLALIFPFTLIAYNSQFEQDKFVHQHYFSNKREGVFVDIGAHDGKSFSNSFFFEKELGWTGICVEPIPEVFEQLKNNRSCILVNGCVTNWTGKGEFLRIAKGKGEMLSGLIPCYDPRHLERIKRVTDGKFGKIIEVDCYKLMDLLEEHNIDHINYLSIDTEGGEFEIIESIDYSKVLIDVITVEDNYHDDRFIPFLEEKGFIFLQRVRCDLYFVRNSLSVYPFLNS